ncbi:MAG: DegQ family serine endoprotease [Alphaproteobacteria bacterium]|nr:DegQ family serine endoprotease [Alphaproteobacteria bacterium]
MIRTIRASLAAGVLGLALTLGTSAHAAAIPAATDGNGVMSLAPLVDQTSPAVVNIATKGKTDVARHPLFNDPFFKRFFGDKLPPEQRETQSVGSGVIVDAKQGYLLTNNHVIEKADEVIITLKDRRQLKAKVVGADPDTDIAVLKVDPVNLVALPLADSEKVQVGDFVVAIGNPFGLGQTVTSGIVSALGRSGLGIEGYEDFIQTDASINPGNSGGALINLRGELVGINTAIIAPGGGNIGIGFAIPINMARLIMDQLIAHGEVQRGRIGVQIQDLTPDLAEAFTVAPQDAAVVSQVTPGSPAETAGIKAGDVITHVNHTQIKGSSDLRNKIGLMRIGEKVTLTVIRDGDKKDVDMVVGEIKETATEQAAASVPKLEGATFGSIPEASPLFGKMEGVLVLDVASDSPAWRAGLRKDDVITSVNRQPVKTAEEFAAAASESSGSLLLNIRRGEGALFILIR